MVSQGRLEAKDLGGELCFESAFINVSAYELADISIDISEVGDHEASDYVDVYIVIDSNTIFIPAWLGEDSTHTIVGDFPDDGDWGDTTLIQTGFSGDSLKFMICVRNNSGTEIIRIDNIRVDDGDTTAGPPPPAVVINEIDCDQSGADTLEFVELYGPPNQSLDSFVLVLFNGNGDVSYAAHDLDGYALDELGFFTICLGPNNSDYCSLNVSGSLQNGTDGVGLYFNFDAADFPNGSAVQGEGLVDGLRYSTGNDGIDVGLSVLDTDPDCSGDLCQIDENAHGSQATHSIQRGSWFVAIPTPGMINENPLPVKLINFDVQLHQNVAILNWETEWEVHNAYFAIEVSSDGRTFLQIGIQDGAHSNMGLRQYNFQYPIRRQGTYYFRLKQVDEDGSFEYSPLRSVSFKGMPVAVFPSLTYGDIYITWPLNSAASVFIYSLQGVLLFKELNVEGGYRQVSMRAMPSGVYVVIVETGNQQVTFKVLRK